MSLELVLLSLRPVLMGGSFLRQRLRSRALLGWMPVLGLAFFLIGGCDSALYVLGEVPSALGGQGGEAPLSECTADEEPCSLDAECCGSLCLAGRCTDRSSACGAIGDPCGSAIDCCSQGCVEGACSSSCVSDQSECESSAECCSGLCESGLCTPLTSSCGTAGNACVQDSQCCSGLCWEGRCDRDSSYCGQTEESCEVGTDCCSGTCTIEEGRSLGVCAQSPTGPSNCTDGIAGTLCDACNDCCSRLCVPYGARGILVCAQAEGCRQTGEICASDVECCGGDPNSSLPGAGNVSCSIGSGSTFGICRNAMSCSPQGNVCHIQDYACGVSAAANKCCAADGEEGVCSLDALGVPRCNGLGETCQALGADCAYDGDCCEGACLPSGSGQLTCAEPAACVDEGLRCTATSECCPGALCEKQSASSFGICDSSRHPVTCSLSGQLCGGGFPECCGEASCSTSGRCEVPPSDAAAE